jgi:hypothetical protein
VFNFTIRSGTNAFHGSAFEYLTNEALNAYQPLATTRVRPVSRKNDFGFTLGGPLSIPKIYNGKDKTFYFFNWEYFRNQTSATGTPQTVPTTAYRGGNFSAALTVPTWPLTDRPRCFEHHLRSRHQPRGRQSDLSRRVRRQHHPCQPHGPGGGGGTEIHPCTGERQPQ